MKIEVKKDLRIKYTGGTMSANTWSDCDGKRRCSIRTGTVAGGDFSMHDLKELVDLLSRVLEDEGQEMAKTGEVSLYAPGTK